MEIHDPTGKNCYVFGYCDIMLSHRGNNVVCSPSNCFPANVLFRIALGPSSISKTVWTLVCLCDHFQLLVEFGSEVLLSVCPEDVRLLLLLAGRW